MSDGGVIIVLYGLNLGDSQDGNMVRVGDYYASRIESRSNTKVEFRLPPGLAPGLYQVSVVVGGG